MHEHPLVTVSGVSMITPLGDSPEMVNAVVRSGLSQINETEFFDQKGDPVRMALVPDSVLDEILEGIQPDLPVESAWEARLLQLASAGLRKIFPLLPGHEPVPLFLACPESRQQDDLRFDRSFLQKLARVSKTHLDLSQSRCISTGRAAGIDAIDLAVRILQSGAQSHLLVGGVDSFFDLDVLDHYLKSERVLTQGAMDGFIPGEASGFLLLTASDSDRSDERYLKCVSAPATSSEVGSITSDEPNLGDGLSEAFRGALAEMETGSVTKVYSSMNGEAFWAKELGIAIVRNQKYFDPDYDLCHPADCFGDLGASMAIVLTGLACTDLELKPENASALVYSSSDTQYRGALVVRSLPGSSRFSESGSNVN